MSLSFTGLKLGQEVMGQAGLTHHQAFEVVLVLQRNDWQRARHLEAKWPPSGVERMRKMTAAEVKNSVAAIVGSSDPKVLEHILRLDLGYEVAPMKDYVVRASKDEPGL